MFLNKLLFLLFLLGSGFADEALIRPVEPVKHINAPQAALGQRLFFDPVLSKDQTISCASCHKPDHGWADDAPVSLGVYGRKGKLNTPTVLNAALNFKQFWNGRSDSLQEQAKAVLHSEFEMDIDEQTLTRRLKADATYRKLFTQAFGKKGITLETILAAIAEFEKTLTTSNAAFDRFLRKEATLSPLQRRGYTLFKLFGCVTCHNGMNLGGNSFQKIGIVIPYKNCFGDRFEITKREFDRCVYKVPTLRNITQTAPYFHDGSATTLQEAIETMAYHNLGFRPKSQEIEAIEAFLRTLDAKPDVKGLR